MAASIKGHALIDSSSVQDQARPHLGAYSICILTQSVELIIDQCRIVPQAPEPPVAQRFTRGRAVQAAKGPMWANVPAWYPAVPVAERGEAKRGGEETGPAGGSGSKRSRQ